MTTEELKQLVTKANAGKHAGTVDDPIPQMLLYTRTDVDGAKKVYTPAGTIIVGGGSGAPADVKHATDTVVGIVKLTDAIDSDLDAATGVTAATPKAVKLALAEAKRYTDENGGGGGTLGYVVTPTITTPAHDATNVSTLPTIAATPYKNVFGTEDPRAHRVFQVASDSGFGTLLVNQNVNADSYAVTTQLTPSTKLYCRVRDVASSGYKSEWSHTVAFTTAAGVVANTPVVTLQGYNNSPTDIGSGLTIVTSAYSVSGGVADTHKATSWSISTRDSTRGVVWQSLNDTVNKTSIVVPAGTLAKGTAYRLSVTYHGTTSFDSSPAVVEFTTSSDFGTVNAPTLTVQGGPNQVFETPSLTGGAFSNTREQDTHDKTDWEILDASGVSPVWQSLNNVSDKTTIIVPKGTLQVATAYKARVRYHGVKFGWSAYTVVDFTTVSEFTHIATPTLTCSDGTENVYETPTIVGSVFTVEPSGSDTHTWTTWNVLQNGTTSVYKLEQSSSALTTLNIPGGVLKVSQSYTVTCVYNGATYGASDAGQITFTTADVFTGPRAPVITVSPSAEAFAPTGTIKAEPQYINGDFEPDKAEWEILPAAGGGALYQSGEVTTYTGMRMLYAPFGSIKLAVSTAYKVRCRQHYADNEQGGTWSQWAEKNFTTSSDYTSVPEWGRIHFRVGAGGGTFKQSDFRWWDAGKLQVMINGAPNSAATITLNESDDVIIQNVLDKNYPDVWFKPMNPSEILEPLPLLTMTTSGTPVTDFGGDVGVEQTGSNRNTSTNKYGLFAQCSNLTTLCDGLFRNNPQVYCLGAMGGGGGGGTGGGDGGGGGGNGGAGASGGKLISGSMATAPSGSNGKSGLGCFAQNASLANVPNDLLLYFSFGSKTLFLGGYGGGGGGGGGCYGSLANGGKGGDGGDAFGIFYDCSALTTIPSLMKNVNIDIFGGDGGNGGAGSNGLPNSFGKTPGKGGTGGMGSSWITEAKITDLSDVDFDNVKLVHSANGANGGIGTHDDAVGGNSGGGGGGGEEDESGSGGSDNGGGGGGGYYGGGGGGGGGASDGANGYQGGNGGVNGGAGGDGDGDYGAGRGEAYDASPSSQVDYSSQHGAFEGFTKLISVPQDLFANIDIESLPNTFKGCTALQNADIKLKCKRIMSAQGFSEGTPTKTIVRVPAGSQTAVTFQNDATSNTNVVLESV